MVALQEDGMVVVTPPGGSMRFGVEDLDQAEDYLRAVAFSVEMLRRQAQARDPHKHVPRGKRGLRGREWGGS